MKKGATILALAALTCSAGLFNPTTAAAKANGQLSGTKVTYNSKKRAVTIKGTSKGVKKVSVTYHGKHRTTVKTGKTGKFSATVKFTGYHNFTLKGLNQKNRVVTKTKTITSKSYATPKVKPLASSNYYGYSDYQKQHSGEIELDFYGKNIVTVYLHNRQNNKLIGKTTPTHWEHFVWWGMSGDKANPFEVHVLEDYSNAPKFFKGVKQLQPNAPKSQGNVAIQQKVKNKKISQPAYLPLLAKNQKLAMNGYNWHQ